MTIFALIMLIAGTAMQAYGSYMQGVQGQETAEYNAAVAEQQAESARRKAAFDEEARRKEGRDLRSRQTVAAAKSGATIESFGDVFAKTATDTELDALLIRYGGQIASGQKESEAALLRKQGKQAYQAGLIGTGTTLLTGGAKTYSRWKNL